MAELNIVLVEPEIPQNTGNIARTCACTGARLHIVKPMGFTVTDKHLKRSGLDYWQYLDLTYYEGLDDFFEKHPDAACFFFTTKAVHRHSDLTYPDGAYLFFGKETAGGYFALEPDTETVVYNYFFDFERAAEDTEDFVATLEKILQLCDIWAERIKAVPSHGGEESSYDAAHGVKIFA